MNIVNFATLGLGSGAIFGLLGIGLVITYRGSGVINFAASATGVFFAYVFYRLNQNAGLATGVALPLALIASGLMGSVIQLVVMRRLRNATALSRVVASLGLFLILVAVSVLAFAPQGESVSVPSLLPVGDWHIGSVVLPQEGAVLTAIAVAVALIVWLLLKYTRIGLATTAVAENGVVAMSIGLSRDAIGAASWAVGSAVATLAIVFAAPFSGLNVQDLANLIIPAMAAALIGSFSSVWLALVGGLLLGIGESEISQFSWSANGWTAAIPLLAIVVLLTMRGSQLPGKGTIVGQLPSLGPGRLRWRHGLYLIAGVIIVQSVHGVWLGAITTTFLMGIVVLSVVVVSGLTGQLSLAQLSMAGLGAFFLAVFTELAKIPALPAGILAVICTALAGLVLAIPAVRTRGNNLAVATLALAGVVEAMIVDSIWTGEHLGTNPLPSLSLFGINFGGTFYPHAFGTLALVAFGLSAIAVSRIRRSRGGRQALAVRANERAAAALGISVTGTKLAMFAIAGALAGLAGVLIEWNFSIANFSLFTANNSLDVTVGAVVGGIGWVSGALLGSSTLSGTVGPQILSSVTSPSNWLELLAGVVVLLTVLQSPGGVVEFNIKQARHLWSKLRGTHETEISLPSLSSVAAVGEAAPASKLETLRGAVSPMAVSVEGITLRFGKVAALDHVTLRIAPGEVVGLIGPNGAGKSTLIDVITGFLNHYEGTVRFNDTAVDRLRPHQRARLGVVRTFQSLELFSDMDLGQNVALAGDDLTLRGLIRGLIHDGSHRDPELDELLSVMGLAPFGHLRPDQVSYGTRQIAALARALARQPGCLCLDEPGAGLDAATRTHLISLLTSISRSLGTGVLLVDHDVDFVLASCSRVIVLDMGKVIYEGPPEGVLSDDRVQAAYFGVEIDTEVVIDEEIAGAAPVISSAAGGDEAELA